MFKRERVGVSRIVRREKIAHILAFDRQQVDRMLGFIRRVKRSLRLRADARRDGENRETDKEK